MPPRSAKVRLRAGVSRSVLPDSRSMKAGTDYVISYDDWRKISGNAKRSVVELVKTGAHSPDGFSDAPVAKNGIDLTHNSATLPTIGATGRAARAGATVEGFGDYDHFILVKATATVAAGDVLVWSNKNLFQATNVHSASQKDFAGVALGAITSGNYGWIQRDGANAGAKVPDGVVPGDVLAVDPTTNAKFRVATGSDVPVATADDDGSGGAGAQTAPVLLRSAKGRLPYRSQRGISPV